MQERWSPTIEGLDESSPVSSDIGHLFYLGENSYSSCSQQRDDQYSNHFFTDSVHEPAADPFPDLHFSPHSSSLDSSQPYELQNSSQQADSLLSTNTPFFVKEFENQQTEKNQTPIHEPVSTNKIQELLLIERDQLKAQQKNTNLLKFLVKAFFRQIQTQLDFYDPLWKEYNEGLRNQIYKNGAEKINRNALTLLFGGSNQSRSPYQKQNRLFMVRLLKSESFKEKNIFESQYIKKRTNRKQYLLSCKIFSLRCRSAALTCRLESR